MHASAAWWWRWLLMGRICFVYKQWEFILKCCWKSLMISVGRQVCKEIWDNLCGSIWEVGCIGCCSRGWLALFLYGGYMRPAYQKVNIQCAIHYTPCYCGVIIYWKSRASGLTSGFVSHSASATHSTPNYQTKTLSDSRILGYRYF